MIVNSYGLETIKPTNEWFLSVSSKVDRAVLSNIWFVHQLSFIIAFLQAAKLMNRFGVAWSVR